MMVVAVMAFVLAALVDNSREQLAQVRLFFVTLF